MVCAPSRRGGRQADCSKGVAIQPSALRRDVAEEGLSEQHTSRHEAGNSRAPHLLQQNAGALDLGGAALPQLAVKPGADVVVERLLDDDSRENVSLPAALAILLDIALSTTVAGLDRDAFT